MSIDPESAETIEVAFLAAIAAAPLDHAPRYVYADWLEEQLDVRAEYLRLACQWSQLSVMDPAQRACQHRMQQLAWSITPAWLAKVVDVAPMNCPAAEFSDQSGCHQCPQRWLTLKATPTPEVRSCVVCQKRVHFCANYHHLSMAIESGVPVALEPSLDTTAYRKSRCTFDPAVAEAARRKSGSADNATSDKPVSDLAMSLAHVDMTLSNSSLSEPPPAKAHKVSWLRNLLSWRSE